MDNSVTLLAPLQAPVRPMSYYVIDDHPLMREAVVMLLRRARPGATVVEVDRLDAVDAAVLSHSTPELFCLDLKLPDTEGVSGVRELKAHYPNTPLAVLSAAPASEWEDQCVEAGADIYIEKSAGAKQIAAALKALMVAESDFETLAPGDTKLSKRQKQLIVMLEQGLSNRDIAEQLGISEHTVKVHLWRLFRRLEVKSRTQAVHYARHHGLLAN